MKEQLFCRVGAYVYPIPPIQTHSESLAEIRLLDGTDGYVTVGAHAFAIKGGVALIKLSELADGVYTVRFVIGDERLESDPIRISKGDCSFVCPSKDTRAKERIENARLAEKIKSMEESIQKLEHATFCTNIF